MARDPASSLTIPQRGNWAIYTRSQSDKLYALTLVDINDIDNSYKKGIDFDGLDDGPTEFAFNISPKSLTLEEPAAVQITPTQAGQFIEHQGQIYKNIAISGTTGMRPNKSAPGGIIPILNLPNPFAGGPSTDPDTGLPKAETTGFDDLINLRNLFRNYWWAKQTPTIANRVLMVWQNGKEGEFYIVEPISFRTQRDSSSPLTFMYDIQLRTIEKLDIRAFLRKQDSYKARTGFEQFFSRHAEMMRDLQAGFSLVNAMIDRLATIGQATLTAILEPLNIVIKGLAQISTTAQGTLAIPRNSVAILVGNCFELADSVDNYKDELNAYKQFGTMTQQALASRVLRAIGRTCANVHNEDRFFAPTLGSSYQSKAIAYRNPVTGMPRSGGSPTNPKNIKAPPGSGSATITKNDTIRTLAQRLLGDAAKWRELVLLNNLKPPYVSITGDGLSVLRPGDEILYPRAASNPSGSVSSSRTKTVTDPIVERLGRDIRLTSTGRGDGLLRDFAVNSKGDLDLVEGVENMEQALINRFSTEPGALSLHPQYGFRFPLGSKVTYRSLIAFKLAGRASLLADSRIANTSDVSMRFEGNTLRVRANIRLVGISDPFGTDFAIRR